MNKILIDFYTKNGRDAEGRSFDNLMAFPPSKLEAVHDYIQWLFPTNKPSAFNPKAPMLDVATIEMLKKSVVFHRRFTEAVARTFRLWEIPHTEIEDEPCALPIIDHRFNDHRYWMWQNDHNLLRMTRVMTSARLLGYKQTALSLFEALFGLSLVENGKFITNINLAFWYEAATGRSIGMARTYTKASV